MCKDTHKKGVIFNEGDVMSSFFFEVGPRVNVNANIHRMDTAFDNYFSVRCDDENTMTICCCKMKNKVYIMNSLLLKMLLSIHQVLSLKSDMNVKAAMTTR